MALQMTMWAPKSEWVPPAELPNIFDAKQIAGFIDFVFEDVEWNEHERNDDCIIIKLQKYYSISF